MSLPAFVRSRDCGSRGTGSPVDRTHPRRSGCIRIRAPIPADPPRRRCTGDRLRCSAHALHKRRLRQPSHSKLRCSQPALQRYTSQPGCAQRVVSIAGEPSSLRSTFWKVDPQWVQVAFIYIYYLYRTSVVKNKDVIIFSDGQVSTVRPRVGAADLHPPAAVCAV